MASERKEHLASAALISTCVVERPGKKKNMKGEKERERVGREGMEGEALTLIISYLSAAAGRRIVF